MLKEDLISQTVTAINEHVGFVANSIKALAKPSYSESRIKFRVHLVTK